MASSLYDFIISLNEQSRPNSSFFIETILGSVSYTDHNHLISIIRTLLSKDLPTRMDIMNFLNRNQDKVEMTFLLVFEFVNRMSTEKLNRTAAEIISYQSYIFGVFEKRSKVTSVLSDYLTALRRSDIAREYLREKVPCEIEKLIMAY